MFGSFSGSVEAKSSRPLSDPTSLLYLADSLFFPGSCWHFDTRLVKSLLDVMQACNSSMREGCSGEGGVTTDWSV